MVKFEDVKVLVAGKHDFVVPGKSMHIYSTTTLIKSDKNIVVDGGSAGFDKKIISGLKKEGLTPDDIDIVILTHTHIDHTYNIGLYKNAKVYLKFLNTHSGMYQVLKDNMLYKIDMMEGFELARDVSVFLTPGHSPDHLSVLVKTDKGNVVVCGDAIASEHAIKDDPNPNLVWSLDEYKKSRKRVLDKADWLIFGHAGLHQVQKL
jgi:glyoxylase-like metal-dependent hydrolase (beta-lactamase superfamily II)